MSAHHLLYRGDKPEKAIRPFNIVDILVLQITELYHQGTQDQAELVMAEFEKTSQDLLVSLDQLYTA